MKQPLHVAVPLILSCLGLTSCADLSQPTGQSLDLGLAKGAEKITICHNGETITVAAPARRAHLAHGDVEGACLSCVAPPADLISWWPGDGDATDIIRTNDGTLQGGATFAAGLVSQAFDFDGVDDHVDVADDASLRGFDDFSYGGWFWTNSFASPHTILSKYNDPLNRHSFGVFHFTTGIVWCAMSNGPSHLPYNFGSTTSSGVVSAGEWHHVMCVRSGTTLELYIDGQLDSSAPVFGTTLDPRADLQIGRDRWWNGGWIDSNYFDGLLDELAIFNRALSGVEIATIFDAGSAGKCKP